MGELLLQPVGDAAPVTVVAAVVVWMHCTRGGVLLDKGWGYWR